jgi:DNA repair protein RecO (recombination protein O)
MRHKYATTATVLARTPLAEAGLLVTLITPDLGIVRAVATGARRSGAKLAHALQTLRESDVMLVRGKEGWRLTGAVLAEDRFAPLSREARMRVARVAGLLLRLVQGDTVDAALHEHFCALLDAPLEGEEGELSETLAVLRVLSTLGYDAGNPIPEGYGDDAFSFARTERAALIARINRGIAAAGA